MKQFQDVSTLRMKILRLKHFVQSNGANIIQPKKCGKLSVKKLILVKSIRIGWRKCKIFERKGDTKCTRSWELGHSKTECKESDRSTLCLKCGILGHKLAMFNKPFCQVCGEEGHRTGRKKCRENPVSRNMDVSRTQNNYD